MGRVDNDSLSNKNKNKKIGGRHWGDGDARVGPAGRPGPGVRVWRNARGVWCCRPYLGTSAATGRPVRPYRQFPGARTEAEALEMAEAWVAPLRAGELSSALAAYVDDVWAMGARKGHGSRANTARNYRLMARRLGEILAGRAASDVSAADVTRAYRLLMDPSGPWRLSARTVEGYHWFLCGAFRWMVEQGVCPSSPMAGVAHPSGSAAGREARALDEADLALLVPALDAAAGGDDPAARAAARASLLALGTGARVGELCALRRRDHRSAVPDISVAATMVEAGGLHRQGLPKGSRPRRVTLSDEDEAAVLAALAERPQDGPDAPLLTPDGSPMRPSEVSGWLRRAASEAGLPTWVRFHTLRHTHATQLLLAGCDMRTVQERLGHADVATTLRLYGHVMPGRDAAAARAMQDAIGRAAPGRGRRA